MNRRKTIRKSGRVFLKPSGSMDRWIDAGANLCVSLVGRRVQRFGGLIGSLRHESLHPETTLEAMDLAPFALNPAVEALASLIMFDLNRLEVKLKT